MITTTLCDSVAPMCICAAKGFEFQVTSLQMCCYRVAAGWEDHLAAPHILISFKSLSQSFITSSFCLVRSSSNGVKVHSLDFFLGLLLPPET